MEVGGEASLSVLLFFGIQRPHREGEKGTTTARRRNEGREIEHNWRHTCTVNLLIWQADSIALGLARGVMAAPTATGSGLSRAWCVDGAPDHHT